jgi:hypothetical protein
MAQFTVETIIVAAIALIGVIFAVYLLILKKNGWLGGNSESNNFYRCPNEDCRGIFHKPIELKDLSETPARICLACPECGADLNRFFGSRFEKIPKPKAQTVFPPKKPEIKPTKKMTEIKPVETPKETQNQKPKMAEKIPAKKSEANRKKINVSNDSKCQYYFGYLADRAKQEGIPDPCLECPRSLDCILTNYKSEGTVTEISKWYQVTA